MSTSALPYVDINPPAGKHDAVVIWLHGLGDSGNGFAPIVPELSLPDSLNIRFVFPHAPMRPITINNGMPMRAWYDLRSMDFNNRADQAGVDESCELVEQLLEQEIAKGIPANRIVLAGFSQGGVIALQLGTRLSQPLAGIMALSTYLASAQTLESEANDANRNTPVFMAHGSHDDVVPVQMGKAAYQTLSDNGYQVAWHEYPMAHNVCMDEIKAISQFLSTVLA